jgi:hypothetical protein
MWGMLGRPAASTISAPIPVSRCRAGAATGSWVRSTGCERRKHRYACSTDTRRADRGAASHATSGCDGRSSEPTAESRSHGCTPIDARSCGARASCTATIVVTSKSSMQRRSASCVDVASLGKIIVHSRAGVADPRRVVRALAQRVSVLCTRCTACAPSIFRRRCRVLAREPCVALRRRDAAVVYLETRAFDASSSVIGDVSTCRQRASTLRYCAPSLTFKLLAWKLN